MDNFVTFADWNYACSHVWLFEGAEGGKWLETLEVDSREPSVFGDSPLSEADEDDEEPKDPKDRYAKRTRVA
jgi:hypothetical protein